MRPKKTRLVLEQPKFDLFKPAGVRAFELEEIILLIEEYEAVRLADYENLKQEEAAILMEISRPTFSRLVDSARKKIALMIIEGKSLKIEGGDFNYVRGRKRRGRGKHHYNNDNF